MTTSIIPGAGQHTAGRPLADIVAELEAERITASDHDRRRPPASTALDDTIRALAELLGYTPAKVRATHADASSCPR